MRPLALLLSFFVVACSSERSIGMDGGGTTDAAVGDAPSAAHDATPGTDATTGIDAGPGSDAGGSMDASSGGAHPPAGYTMCGGASFTAMEAHDACAMAPTIGTLPYPTACDAATSMGGRYEIWCPPTSSGSLYFWAELDAVQAAATMCSVPWDGGFLPLTVYGELGGGRVEGHTGARGTGSDLPGGPTILEYMPVTAELDGLISFGGDLGMNGTLLVWVAFTPGECPGSTTHPGPRYVLGIGASWASPDA